MVTPEQLFCVAEVADSVVSEPFSIEIEQVGYWKRPRILWCGPVQTSPSLQSLVRDLQQGLIKCGFEPEKRTYSPHVTMARKAGPVVNHLLEYPLSWQPTEFVLASSRHGGVPPRYQIIGRWPLEG